MKHRGQGPDRGSEQQDSRKSGQNRERRPEELGGGRAPETFDRHRAFDFIRRPWTPYSCYRIALAGGRQEVARRGHAHAVEPDDQPGPRPRSPRLPLPRELRPRPLDQETRTRSCPRGDMKADPAEDPLAFALAVEVRRDCAWPYVEGDPRENPCDGRGPRDRGSERHFDVALERRMGGTIAGSAEERLVRLAKGNLDPVGADDCARRDDLGPLDGALARPVEGAAKGHAGRLAGRKPGADQGNRIAQLDSRGVTSTTWTSRGVACSAHEEGPPGSTPRRVPRRPVQAPGATSSAPL